MRAIMKLTVRQLRKIIREAVNQQTALGVMTHGGSVLDDEDQERLAYGGFLGVDEVDEIEEDDGLKQ